MVMVPISPFLPESSSRGAHHVKAAVGDNDRIAPEEGRGWGTAESRIPLCRSLVAADDDGIYRLIINWKMMRKPTHRRRRSAKMMERKLGLLGKMGEKDNLPLKVEKEYRSACNLIKA